MNDLIRKSAGYIKKRIGLDNAILFICLLTLAVHYYFKVGGASDVDEEYYFYTSSAISRGAGIYTDLHIFYPPVLLYLGAAFFKVFSDLYHAMLAIRIFITTLSLIGFYLIFDMFRKLKLSWFMIPAALFILYSMQLDLLVIKFRPDNALSFVLILQAYLLFLLSMQEKRSDLNVFLIMLLGILSFHISQKAVSIELLLMLAFLMSQFDVIRRFILKYRIALLSASFLTALYVIFSQSYHRFFYQCYMAVPAFFKGMDRWHHYTFSGNMDFLLLFVRHNIAFWLTGLASFLTLLFYIKRNKAYLIPLMFLVGTFLVIVNGIIFICPYLQYQLYFVWAVLFALPYFIGICCEAFPKRSSIIFLIILLSALSGYFTYGRYVWPSKPLKTFASEIDLVRQAIGKDGLASLGGASINIPTALPYSDARPGIRDDYKNVRGPLIEKATKFIFLDQRMDIKRELFGEDGRFIAANYQVCRGLPLMIASKWVYVDADLKYLPVDIAGSYKILLFRRPNTSVELDGRALKSIQVQYLSRGRHALNADGPAALLIEYDAAKTSSESLYNIDLSGYEFIPLKESFSGVFELLGVIRYKKSNKLFYHLFWKVLSGVNDYLMTFHHFCDTSGNYVAGANIDPTDGWYDIRSLKKDEVISYDLSVVNNKKYSSVNFGWYFKKDWSIRLPYNGTTFYTLKL